MFASSTFLIGFFFIISYGHGIMFSIRLFISMLFLDEIGIQVNRANINFSHLQTQMYH